MAKTAAQFIDECDSDTHEPYVFAPIAVEACEAFAAQEVKAYKERLKNELEVQFQYHLGLQKDLIAIIDAVK